MTVYTEITPKQEAVLAALLTHPTIAAAAEAVGVCESTIYRWLTDDSAFKAEWLRLRREVLQGVVLQLQKACADAVRCLGSIVNDPDAPASARVAAAREVLDRAFKALELDNIEARITALEEK